MKSNILITKTWRSWCGLPYRVWGVLLVSTFISCEKSKEDTGRVTEIIVSEDAEQAHIISAHEFTVEGGKDTLYVFGDQMLDVNFETSDPNTWVKVDKMEPVGGKGGVRLILEVSPMQTQFKKRTGVLNIKGAEAYSGKFIRFSQGYDTRIAEEFAWLRYGNGNPLDEGRGTLIGQWTNAQKEYGWTNPGTAATSKTYGMNGFVQLGSADFGGTLLSAVVPGIEKDSLLLLTFNAVAYTARNGEQDGNKLTIKLKGAEFADGQTSKMVELKYYDHQSALILTKMWEETQAIFALKKPVHNPTASTIQLEFITGDGQEMAKNRLFVDNINLYTTAQFQAIKK
ncbi:hypothetical protein E2P86_12255 [Sphingobacterium psychroaquaticum]|uniref:hypothetical protein n=1 Tax=Sphingobacterium psychroaquaticum TaxID=561061 RepID=UPI001068D6A2|nr:hypothetical protein [Sphingobacterium psychroaquaticum]QBQ41884.1 hypothetical protein E2P86_12255 [Sphingobacterium psychroaquaticum]